ncbi:MAG: peptidase M75 [Hydrococcus sp. RU_2_2]|nr:peptidase M75 [Hydrococcus sp. RU_2_2]NJP18148.1 peptidase M75 [Hydrococcus sp. CRU_1_1]
MVNYQKTLNKNRLSIATAILLGLVTFGTGCSNNTSQPTATTESQPTATTEAQSGDIKKVIVSDFANQVVIPTYQLLVTKSGDLSKAVDAFVAKPGDDTLKAAQEAWRASRTPWEQSEAFAFGPASSLGYDGDLDDWPVNETDVKAVISSKAELTPESIKQLQTTQKGFHTIEYLLFGLNNDRKAADLSEREIKMLKLLTDAFNQTAQDLTKSWVEGVNGNPAYSQVFATAGDSGNNSYPTVNAALEEIVQGKIGCLDEVANEKIGEPLKEKTTKDLESRFSHHSLEDFKSNIRSVENAYLGRAAESNESKGKSISNLVAQTDPKLDEQVKSELQAALVALDAVPNPVEPKMSDADALSKLEAAQKAIATVQETMEQKVLPIVKG